VRATPLEVVLGRLLLLGCDPRPVGRGWAARCPDREHGPGHEKRLLEITGGTEGPVVVECCESAEAAERTHIRLVPKDPAP
jgi:hypothetical protein